MHTGTRLPPIMNKHDPLEQDNINGINGIPEFSRFLIYLRLCQEHGTKVTDSIMQSHNATDLSNNTDVESWQTNV